MKIRRLFAMTLCLLSLAVCLTTLFLWLYAYQFGIHVMANRTHFGHGGCSEYELYVNHGEMRLTSTAIQPSSPETVRRLQPQWDGKPTFDVRSDRSGGYYDSDAGLGFAFDHGHHYDVGNIFIKAPCWFVALLSALFPVVCVIRTRRAGARRRGNSKGCPACGYNLTANTSRVCPECGITVSSTVD